MTGDLISLHTQLNNIGANISTTDLIEVMIYALAPEYGNLATTLTNRGDFPDLTISDVTSAFEEEETRKIEAGEIPAPMMEAGDAAYVARVGRNSATGDRVFGVRGRRDEKVCENCERTGHEKANCWRPGGGSDKKCFRCDKEGHTARYCEEEKPAHKERVNYVARDAVF
ncbi:hypothetical protein DL96DRAFT_1558688 [Flagelloscypha sp. PMI_526]|nr:hypothetical protein DL96DRAFT_1569677 [Flagelloscypha sp. PMI_526]KAH8823798.1 hypothetical protein DL96DRAFT_1558688 [Flagelloscypha sp. PMI_526]